MFDTLQLNPKSDVFLASDASVRTNRRAIAMMLVRLSVCLSGMGMHCEL